MSDLVIYLGPSLSLSEAREILDAEYLPPIRRGNLARIRDRTGAVGIIDGEFFQSLAVSPKEVLKTMTRGIKVYGAASMGALRAAEMCDLGVIGVGKIFAMFRDAVLDADDEVAVVYDPISYRTFSDPLVNLRCALDAAVAEGAIGADAAERLLREMQSRYFPSRSFRALEALCPTLRSYCRAPNVRDLKAEDARELLRRMRQDFPVSPCTL